MKFFKTVIALVGVLSFFAFTNFQEIGIASYYPDSLEGNLTASGEVFDQQKMTCAHKSLPFGTMLKVTRLDNGNSVIVRVNDRGPFVPGRIVDLARAAAERIGMIREGLTKVKIEEVHVSKVAEVVKRVAIKELAPKEYSNEVSLPSTARMDKAKGEWLSTKSVTTKTSGYAVQIGAFKELTFMDTYASAMRRDYGGQVMTAAKHKNGQTMYKVVIGPFRDRATAQRFLNELASRQMDGFIVDLSTLDVFN